VSRPVDHADILLVLPPCIGHPYRFASLGVAQLLAGLRAAGLRAHSVNLSELLFRLERPLYDALYDAASLERFYDRGVWGDDPTYLDALLSGAMDLALAASVNGFADVAAERIVRAAPAMVGLSVLQSNVPFALALGRRLQRAGLPVVIGGPAGREPALAARLVADACRVIVTGEADLTLPELVAEHRATGCLPPPGTILAGRQVPDLDRLPPPDFDTTRALGWMPAATSRGCTSRCRFCEEATLFKGIRRRSVASVLEELAINRERFRPQGIQFHDSLINHDEDWLGRFCDALAADPRGLEWQSFARPAGLDDALLERVARSRCTALHFGVEHFAQPVSDRLGKRLDVEDARRTIARAAAHGIPVKILLIEGVPGETEDDHRRNLDVVGSLMARYPELVDLAANPLTITPHSVFVRFPERYGIRLRRDAAGRVIAREFVDGPDGATIARWTAEVLALKPLAAPGREGGPGARRPRRASAHER